MADSLIPDNVNKAMISVANYLREGVMRNDLPLDTDTRNLILGEWLPMCFPTKGDWEAFADGISDGSIDATSPYKQITQAQALKINEKFLLDRLGYTTVKCSQLHKGDLIRIMYNGERVIALVLEMVKASSGYFLYFTIRGVLKNTRVYKQVKEPFNGCVEESIEDFKVVLYSKKQIPKGYRGLGNLIMPKPQNKRSVSKPTGVGGKVVKGVTDYLGRETTIGRGINSIKKFMS